MEANLLSSCGRRAWRADGRGSNLVRYSHCIPHRFVTEAGFVRLAKCRLCQRTIFDLRAIKCMRTLVGRDWQAGRGAAPSTADAAQTPLWSGRPAPADCGNMYHKKCSEQEGPNCGMAHINKVLETALASSPSLTRQSSGATIATLQGTPQSRGPKVKAIGGTGAGAVSGRGIHSAAKRSLTWCMRHPRSRRRVWRAARVADRRRHGHALDCIHVHASRRSTR